jgi:hypothetical protein
MCAPSNPWGRGAKENDPPIGELTLSMIGNASLPKFKQGLASCLLIPGEVANRVYNPNGWKAPWRFLRESSTFEVKERIGMAKLAARFRLQEGVMIKLPIILVTVIAAVPCCAQDVLVFSG